MATIAEIRAGFQAWFESKVRIDVWSANPPTNIATVIAGVPYPANSAIASPISGFSITNKLEASPFPSRFQMMFAITYRFDSALKYHELPLDQAEVLATSLMIRAIAEAPCINDDLLTVEVGSYDPVEVAKYEQPRKTDGQDWLIILKFPFEITANIDIGDSGIDGPGDDPDPPHELNSLTFGIWRSEIGHVGDSDRSVLDFETAVLNPNP